MKRNKLYENSSSRKCQLVFVPFAGGGLRQKVRRNSLMGQADNCGREKEFMGTLQLHLAMVEKANRIFIVEKAVEKANRIFIGKSEIVIV